jgi:hydrogenase maturation protease
VTILGIGNLLRGDDAAGLLAARLLRELLPGVRVLELQGDIAAAIDAWEGETAVLLIDAVRSGAPAGTIHRFEAHAAPLPARFFRSSTHLFGAADAIELARALGRLPSRLIVYGIEAASFEPGAALTPAVEAGVAALVERVAEEARAG